MRRDLQARLCSAVQGQGKAKQGKGKGKGMEPNGMAGQAGHDMI